MINILKRLYKVLLNALILFGIIILKNIILKPYKITELIEIGNNVFSNSILAVTFSLLLIYGICIVVVSFGGFVWWISDTIRKKVFMKKTTTEK